MYIRNWNKFNLIFSFVFLVFLNVFANVTAECCVSSFPREFWEAVITSDQQFKTAFDEAYLQIEQLTLAVEESLPVQASSPVQEYVPIELTPPSASPAIELTPPSASPVQEYVPIELTPPSASPAIELVPLSASPDANNASVPVTSVSSIGIELTRTLVSHPQELFKVYFNLLDLNQDNEARLINQSLLFVKQHVPSIYWSKNLEELKNPFSGLNLLLHELDQKIQCPTTSSQWAFLFLKCSIMTYNVLLVTNTLNDPAVGINIFCHHMELLKSISFS